ncbi:MAG: hypothetical protein R3D52_08595 [Xanthobacteraceae bacterium]
MQEGDPFKKGTIAMTLLNLDYAASIPDIEPRKKGLLARVYGALYRARMAHVERLLREYRPLLDDTDAQAQTRRTYPLPVID